MEEDDIIKTEKYIHLEGKLKFGQNSDNGLLQSIRR